MHTVYMNNIQYTIRGIPRNLDDTLRLRAKKRRQSFNSLLVDTLKKGALVTSGASGALDTSRSSSSNEPKNNLDWFYGSGGIGEVEKQTFASQRVINPKDWQAQ